eukprot:1443675-Rhodomonas_salina.1
MVLFAVCDVRYWHSVWCCLRCAMSGTGIAIGTSPRACSAVSGTEMVYGPARSYESWSRRLREVSAYGLDMQCPHMVISAYVTNPVLISVRYCTRVRCCNSARAMHTSVAPVHELCTPVRYCAMHTGVVLSCARPCGSSARDGAATG